MKYFSKSMKQNLHDSNKMDKISSNCLNGNINEKIIIISATSLYTHVPIHEYSKILPIALNHLQ